jgi:hypothetical protein
MAFDSGHRIHRSPDVVHRVIQGEAVLLDLHSGRYFGLNATGAALWELLGSDGATMSEVEARMGERFEVTPEVLHRDLEDVLGSLEREKLIRVER